LVNDLCTNSFLPCGLNLPAAVFIYLRACSDTVTAFRPGAKWWAADLDDTRAHLRLVIPRSFDDDLLQMTLDHHGECHAGL